MDTAICRSYILAFLFLALLSFTKGLEIMEDNKVCGNPSETWKGICYYSDHCERQCINEEKALGGRCLGESGFDCWCFFSCQNLCVKPSGIWKGACFKSNHCSIQCREKENSLRGRCSGFKCECLYNCNYQ